MTEDNKHTQSEKLRQEILSKVAEYYQVAHQREPFIPGETFVNYGGRVYNELEMQNAVDAILEFWLTDGPRVASFSTAMSAFLGLQHVMTVNSGSSANLVAMTALCSEHL